MCELGPNICEYFTPSTLKEIHFLLLLPFNRTTPRMYFDILRDRIANTTLQWTSVIFVGCVVSETHSFLKNPSLCGKAGLVCHSRDWKFLILIFTNLTGAYVKAHDLGSLSLIPAARTLKVKLKRKGPGDKSLAVVAMVKRPSGGSSSSSHCADGGESVQHQPQQQSKLRRPAAHHGGGSSVRKGWAPWSDLEHCYWLWSLLARISCNLGHSRAIH